MDQFLQYLHFNSTSCCSLQQGCEHITSPPTHCLKHTDIHTLLPQGSNTEQYWQLGSQPKAQGCSVGGGEQMEEWQRSGGGAQLLPALSGLVREWGGWGERGGEKERRGSERGRESLAGSPALSFTPNQALVWAWNAFVFQNIIIASSDSSRGNPSSLIRRGEGRRKEEMGGHRRQLGRGGRSAEGQTHFYLT